MNCEGNLHRFNMGQRICRCGGVLVPPPHKGSMALSRKMLRLRREPYQRTESVIDDIYDFARQIQQLRVAMVKNRAERLSERQYALFIGRYNSLLEDLQKSDNYVDVVMDAGYNVLNHINALLHNGELHE